MSWRALANPAFVVALGVLLVGALTMGRAIDAMGIYLQKQPIQPEGDRKVRQILTETDRWIRVGPDLIEAADVVKTLGTSNYVSRAYAAKDPDGRPDLDDVVDFHAAYYTGMIDTVPHVPERCFVGGGWQIAADSRIVDVPLDPSGWILDEDAGVYLVRISNRNHDRPGQRVPLPRGVTPDGGLKMRVTEFYDPKGRRVFTGYFFIANGGTVASAEGVRLLAFDLTQDYAYYLKVQVTSLQAQSAEELGAVTGELLDDLLPEIMLCVPDWTKVRAGTYPDDRPDTQAE